ncbi:MAG: Gfo/Idh/MocA family oxidoreductase [Planctomycetota bacterium]
MANGDLINDHTPTAPRPVRLGIAGVGGYGQTVIAAVRELGGELAVPFVLAGSYEAFPERHAGAVADLADAGVRRHDGLAAMAEDPGVDAVWLALPIPHHAEATRAVLAAGKAVMCEKPAAAALGEIDAMIAARDAADRPTLIGFQEMYHPETLRLKRLLTGGGIGRLRRVTVTGFWPRNRAYFRRSAWAGRRVFDGRPVHDSPVANAMAHFVNLALFFAGAEPGDTAEVTELNAGLYRAAAIENFDTALVHGRTDAGPEVFMGLTHACVEQADPVIRLVGDGGEVTRTLGEVTIRRAGRDDEAWPLPHRSLRPMFEAFGRVIRGDPPDDRVAATLERSRPHVALIQQLASHPVRDVPADLIEPAGDGERQVLAVRGIHDTLTRLENGVAAGELPYAPDDRRGVTLPGT